MTPRRAATRDSRRGSTRAPARLHVAAAVGGGGRDVGPVPPVSPSSFVGTGARHWQGDGCGCDCERGAMERSVTVTDVIYQRRVAAVARPTLARPRMDVGVGGPRAQQRSRVRPPRRHHRREPFLRRSPSRWDSGPSLSDTSRFSVAADLLDATSTSLSRVGDNMASTTEDSAPVGWGAQQKDGGHHTGRQEDDQNVHDLATKFEGPSRARSLVQLVCPNCGQVLHFSGWTNTSPASCWRRAGLLWRT